MCSSLQVICSRWFLLIDAFENCFIDLVFHLILVSFFSLSGVCWNLTRFITSSNSHGTIKHELGWIGTSNFFQSTYDYCMTSWSSAHDAILPDLLEHYVDHNDEHLPVDILTDWKGKDLDVFWESEVEDHDVLATLGFLTQKNSFQFWTHWHHQKR